VAGETLSLFWSDTALTGSGLFVLFGGLMRMTMKIPQNGAAWRHCLVIYAASGANPQKALHSIMTLPGYALLPIRAKIFNGN
jgi:hypothetical protein